MFLLDGERVACLQCIKGHRAADCLHRRKPLLSIKSRGRPHNNQNGVRLRYDSPIITHQGIVSVDTKNHRSNPGSTKTAFFIHPQSLFTMVRVKIVKNNVEFEELSLLEANTFMLENPGYFKFNNLDEEKQGKRFDHGDLPPQNFLNARKDAQDKARTARARENTDSIYDSTPLKDYTVYQIHDAQRVLSLMMNNDDLFPHEGSFLSKFNANLIDPCAYYTELSGVTRTVDYLNRRNELFERASFLFNTSVCSGVAAMRQALKDCGYSPDIFDPDRQFFNYNNSQLHITNPHQVHEQFPDIGKYVTDGKIQVGVAGRIQQHGYNAPNYVDNLELFNTVTHNLEYQQQSYSNIDFVNGYGTGYNDLPINEYNNYFDTWHIELKNVFEQNNSGSPLFLRNFEPLMKYRDNPEGDGSFDFDLQFRLNPSKFSLINNSLFVFHDAINKRVDGNILNDHAYFLVPESNMTSSSLNSIQDQLPIKDNEETAAAAAADLDQPTNIEDEIQERELAKVSVNDSNFDSETLLKQQNDFEKPAWNNSLLEFSNMNLEDFQRIFEDDLNGIVSSSHKNQKLYPKKLNELYDESVPEMMYNDNEVSSEVSSGYLSPSPSKQFTHNFLDQESLSKNFVDDIIVEEFNNSFKQKNS